MSRRAEHRARGRKRLIVVLGMHRSGTSALARGLQVLRVDLGQRLLPPLEGNNPKGFWEDADINGLNIEILNALSSDWHFLTPAPDNYLEDLRQNGLFLRAVTLLREKVSNSSVFGVKDPRIPMLLSFWREVFTECALDVAYVLAIRNPLSVAQSLAARDGFLPAKSHLLWLRSILGSLSVAGSAACIAVDFDVLMQSPEGELHRIAEALDLQVDQPSLERYVEDFLDQNLRHTTFSPDDVLLDGRVPPLVAEVYAALNREIMNNRSLGSPMLQQKIKRWGSAYREMHCSLSLADSLYTANQNYQRELAGQTQETARLSQQLAIREAAVTELGATVQSLLLDRNALQDGAAKLQESFSTLKQERNNIVLELTTTIESLIVDRNAHKSEVELLRESSAKCQQEQTALLDKLNLEKSEGVKLSKMIASLGASREALEAELATARDLLTNSLLEQEALVDEASRRSVESTERERQLHDMFDSLSSEHSYLKDELRIALTKGESLSQTIEIQKADCAALERELKTAKNSLATAQHEWESLSRATSQKLGASEEMAQELSETVRELSETVSSLVIDRDAYKTAVIDLIEIRAAHERALRESAEQRASLEHSVRSLRGELSAVYRSRTWRLNLALRRITRRGIRRQNEKSALSLPDLVPHPGTTNFMTQPVVPCIPVPDEVASKSRILLVSHYCPTRAHAGGLRILDMYSLIRKRCPSVQLDLFTHHRPGIDWSLEDVHRIFDNVYLSASESLSFAGLANLRHSSLPYDVIDLQFHQSAYGLDGFRSIGKKIIFTPMESLAKVFFYDLRALLGTGGHLRLAKLAASLRNASEEIVHCRKADAVVCVSRADAAFLRVVTAQRNVEGVDTGVSTLEFAEGLDRGFSPLPAAQRPQKILYVAYFGSETNRQALRWFLDKVHPLIRAVVPGYVLTVVGRGDLADFANDAHQSIELVGEVPAIAPYVAQARVGIAPALGGSGFRGKVNQYAVMGVPSVVSSIASKGLAYKHGKDIFVEDAPEDFAKRCISLLVDAELSDRMGAAARQLCIDKYTWESKWPTLSRIYGLSNPP